MVLGMIRPIALSHLSQECLSLMIFRRCHSALYGCLVHNFLPEVSHGSLARVQVLRWHSRCRACEALRARGSPSSRSILPDLNSLQMVQGMGKGHLARVEKIGGMDNAAKVERHRMGWSGHDDSSYRGVVISMSNAVLAPRRKPPRWGEPVGSAGKPHAAHQGVGPRLLAKHPAQLP